MPPEELLRELLPILQERYGMDASTPEALQAIERIQAGDMEFIGELTGDIGSLQTGGHLAAQMGLGATSMLDQFAKSAKLAPRVLGSLAPRLAGLTTIPGIAANVGLGAYGLLNLLQGASRVDDVGLFGRGEESTVDNPVMQAIESPAGQMAFGGLDVGLTPQLRSALKGVFRRGGQEADAASDLGRIEFADDAGEAAAGSVIKPTVQPGQGDALDLGPLSFDETGATHARGVDSGAGGRPKDAQPFRPHATTESMTVGSEHGIPITTSGPNVGRRFPSQRNERGQEINRIRFADEGRPLDDPYRNLEGDATPIQTFREVNRYKHPTSTRNVSPRGRTIPNQGWGKSRFSRNEGKGPSGVVSRNIGEQYGRGTFDPDKLGATDAASREAADAANTQLIVNVQKMWDEIETTLKGASPGAGVKFPLGRLLKDTTDVRLFQKLRQLGGSGPTTEDFKARLDAVEQKWRFNRAKLEGGFAKDDVGDILGTGNLRAEFEEQAIKMDSDTLQEIQQILSEYGADIAGIGKRDITPGRDESVAQGIQEQFNEVFG
jgi:hypothetical protein|tara:strand:+ start:656 stop:2302 length:1647 start_codon:yes stop_codon:yes gene_type:complete